MKKLIPRISFITGLMSLVGCVVLILLLLFNPLFKKTKPANLPLLKIYLDHSQSVFPFKADIKELVGNIESSWKGNVEIIPFSRSISKRIYKPNEFDQISFFNQPTFFNRLNERLLFSSRDEKNLVISDFIWADASKYPIADNIHYVNLSELAKLGEGEKFATNPDQTSPELASVILNQEPYYNPEQPLKLQLLFYHKSLQAKIEYQLIKVDDQNVSTSKPWKKVKIDKHYLELNEVVDLSLENSLFYQIKVKVRKINSKLEDKGLIINDSMNFFPNKKKLNVTFLFFKPTKEGQAMKNALERYQFFDVKYETLFKPENFSKAKLSAYQDKGKLYFLIAPPSEVVDFFRAKNNRFVYFPDFYTIDPNVPFKARDLDFKYSFNNFLGEIKESENKWQNVERNFLAYKLNPQQSHSGKTVKTFQGNKSNSYFFQAENEIFLGIKSIHRLNEKYITSSEDSYLDLFLVRLVQYFWDDINKNDLEQHFFNFVLGEKIESKKLIRILPHLDKVTTEEGDEYYVSPYLKHAGDFPQKEQNSLTPINYRVPFREYYPAENTTPYRSTKTREEILGVGDTLMKSFNLNQVEVIEVSFRDDLKIYFLLIFLFIIFLISKWGYFKWKS